MNKTPKNLQFKWNEEDTNVDTGEVNQNFIYAEDEPPEIEDTIDLELPDISKTEIVESDIFDDKSIKRLSPVSFISCGSETSRTH